MTADPLAATSPADAAPHAYPDGWRVVRLGDVARVLYGKARPHDAGDIPVIGSGGAFGTTTQAITSSETLVIGRKGAAGAVFYCPTPCYPSDTAFYLDWVDEICVPFVFYHLLHRGLAPDRSVIPSLARADVEGYRLPLPPLAEQRAIARVLRAVQEAIAARRREVGLEREHKAALLQRLFTRGTRGEATKQTAIGEAPESWQVVRFSEVIDIVQGQVDPRIEPYRSMRHVGPENIEEGTGQITSARTAGDLNLISGKYLFSPDHVLYSKIRPYLRKAAIPWFDGICSADMYPLKPRANQIERDFVLYILLGESFTAQVTASQDRTGIPKVNRNQLGAVHLPLPSPSEQREIADTLAACDTHIAALERENALHDELFRGLLEELMSGRVSALGLVEEEPASAPLA